MNIAPAKLESFREAIKQASQVLRCSNSSERLQLADDMRNDVPYDIFQLEVDDDEENEDEANDGKNIEKNEEGNDGKSEEDNNGKMEKESNWKKEEENIEKYEEDNGEKKKQDNNETNSNIPEDNSKILYFWLIIKDLVI